MPKMNVQQIARSMVEQKYFDLYALTTRQRDEVIREIRKSLDKIKQTKTRHRVHLSFTYYEDDKDLVADMVADKLCAGDIENLVVEVD